MRQTAERETGFTPAGLAPGLRLWVGLLGSCVLALYAVLLVLAIVARRGYMLSLWANNLVILAIFVAGLWFGWRSGRILAAGGLVAGVMFVLGAVIGLSGHTLSQSLVAGLHPVGLAQTLVTPVLAAGLFWLYVRSYGPVRGG